MPLQIINSLDLLIAQTCNLACVYCFCHEGDYQNSGNMTNETAQKAIDWLVSHSGGVKNLYINFFGGEPLVNFSVLKKTVLYARERETLWKKQFHFRIITNGVSLTEEVEVFLDEQGILIGASIDGPAEIQNRQRPHRGGKASYDRVMANFSRVLNRKPSMIPVSQSVYLSPNEYTPLQIKHYLESIGFPYSSVQIASNTLEERKIGKTENDRSLLFPMLDAEANDICATIAKQDTTALAKYKPSLIYKELLRQIQGKTLMKGCAAGRSYFAVDIQGDIYLCHSLVGFEKYKVGSIKEKRLSNNPIFAFGGYPKECTDCRANMLCAGGCYFENVLGNKDLFKPQQHICDYMKYIVDLSHGLYDNLKQEDINFLKTLA